MSKFFSKERLRLIVSFILSLLICLGLFFTAICADLLIFSNPSFLLSCAEKSNYSKFAVSQITEELNDLAIPSGLPKNFFTDKIDEISFSKLFYNGIDNQAKGNKNYTLNVDKFKKEVHARVTEYSQNEGGGLTSEVEKDIERFSQECSNIYLSYANPSLINYIFDILVSVKKYLWIALAISFAFTLVVGIFLFKLNHKGAFLKNCFCSCCGAALTLGIVPIYLIATNEIARISISSKSLYAITTTMAEQFLWIMIISAAVLLFVSLIFLGVKIFRLIFKG